MLRKWEDLPARMQTDELRPYYEMLQGKKAELAAKRAFDVLASGTMLAVLSPALLGVGIIIRAEDGGPAIYRQTRVTQYGREFRIFKYRTMVVNADKIGAQVTSNNDRRITRIGNFLRKYRIDEVPQLLNILAGDMSFVGTRPEVPKYVEAYDNEMMATLLLRAGVTSEASIEYKDEAELLQDADNADETYIKKILPEKMKYNLKELRNFSIGQELKLLFRTVKAVLK